MRAACAIGLCALLLWAAGCASTSPPSAPAVPEAWQWSADSSGWHFAFGPLASPRLYLPRDANGYGYWQQDSVALVFYGQAFAFIDSIRPAPSLAPIANAATHRLLGMHGETRLIASAESVKVILPDQKAVRLARTSPRADLMDSLKGTVQLALPIAVPLGFGAYDQPFQVGSWRLLRSPLYGLFVWYGPEANYAIRLWPGQSQWSWRAPNRRPSVPTSHVAHTIFSNGIVVEGGLDFAVRPWEDIPAYAYRRVFSSAPFVIRRDQEETVIRRTSEALVIEAPSGAQWAFDLDAPQLQYTSPSGLLRRLPELPGVRR